MAHFRDLTVWQKSLTVAKRIYGITRELPGDQRFSLSDQMQRASVSIISNIAEGSKRGRKDCSYFFRIAHGSAAELEAQIVLCFELGFIKKDETDILLSDLDQVQKMLYVLVRNSTSVN